MNSQSEEILAKLTLLISKDDRGQAGIAEKIGYSDGYLSEVFRRKKPVAKRFAEKIEALMVAKGTQREPSGSIVRGDDRSRCAESEPQPIGHIPFEGRDWKMSVPVFKDDALTQKMLAAARALIGTPAPTQAPPTGTTSAVPSPEIAVALAEADRRGDEVHTMSTGTVTPSNP